MPALLLHADDPAWCPADTGVLIGALESAGLIGAPWVRAGRTEYRAGDAFLKLVTFLGCSPQVALDPRQAADGQKVCSLAFESFADIVFLSSHPLPAMTKPLPKP